MARRPASITQADDARAIRAAKAAGVDVQRIEIDPNGKIVIVVVGSSEPDQREMNEWDRV
jgi:hypothetical protein